MFKLFYILKLKFEIYNLKQDNAFARTVSIGFKKAGEKKLEEVKKLYEEVDERKKIESHKREDRDKIKDLESQIEKLNVEIDQYVDTHNSVEASILRHENEIKTWIEKIKFVRKW